MLINKTLTLFSCLRRINELGYSKENQYFMKLLYIKRQTKTEKRYSINMGELITKVTYIKKYFFGLPIKTMHEYRETYYGEVKDCDDCALFI